MRGITNNGLIYDILNINFQLNTIRTGIGFGNNTIERDKT